MILVYKQHVHLLAMFGESGVLKSLMINLCLIKKTEKVNLLKCFVVFTQKRKKIQIKNKVFREC